MVKEYLDKYKEEFKKCIEDLKHKDTWYKQLPNMLTCSRAIGAPIISIIFLTGHPIVGSIATILLLLTDLVDGKLARKWEVVSKFGADLDAFCDKLMFLGFAIPLMVNYPVIIINFILEGVISFINVFGRMKGLDTKTVFAGKAKTCFLSITLIVGFLVQYLGISNSLLKILSSMTIGAQIVSIDRYIAEYKRMKNEKEEQEILNECVEFPEQESEMEQENKVEVLEKDLTEQLKKERKFLLEIKEPDNKVESNVKKRGYGKRKS